jgi:twitching motility protein PilT
MGLFKNNLISYKEALRQATNPDDFALRVSGISATSDTSWDSFERPGDPPAAPQPPVAAATTPKAEPTTVADDDFKIERF